MNNESVKLVSIPTKGAGVWYKNGLCSRYMYCSLQIVSLFSSCEMHLSVAYPNHSIILGSWNFKMDHNTCLELALEGERLCKGGDFRAGVAFFEAAVQVGTDDLKILSAIYSQLGNAFFYLGEYAKAMEYHKLDLTLARTINDLSGEAKASGNLGNTLKMMGKFDEAMICCRRHLDISRELTDKVGEGRALYNLGNVYHAKGKQIARMGPQDPGDFPDEVKSCLQKAVEYYEENLKLMIELGDRLAQGRACGNLGNTHYLLGNFSQAVSYHEERLKIAKEFGDRAAERRAYSNLGNAHIFLGEFEIAAEHYKQTLALAEELGDRAVEAQACYSLGNTYTLLRDYPTAIEYHMRHHQIAQELRDRIGEGRACWSLGNAHSAIGNHEKALTYALRHLEISKEIGDRSGQATAQVSISDLKKLLGAQNPSMDQDLANLDSTPAKRNRLRRVSMEHMDLLKLTPEGKAQACDKLDSLDEGANKENLETLIEAPSSSHGSSEGNRLSSAESSSSGEISETTLKAEKQNGAELQGAEAPDEDNFLDLLARFQSKRMDDQRCSLASLENRENHVMGNRCNHSNAAVAVNPLTRSASVDNPESAMRFHEELFDLIAGMQSRRLDEQRATLPPRRETNGEDEDEIKHRSNSCSGRNSVSNPNNNNNRTLPRRSIRQMSLGASTVPDDDFFEMLMRCQASRLEDQRSNMPSAEDRPMLERPLSIASSHSDSPAAHAPTVPDEDFFSLILRFQAGRIEDQRSSLPSRPVGAENASSSRKATGSNKSGGILRCSLKHGTKANRSSKSKN